MRARLPFLRPMRACLATASLLIGLQGCSDNTPAPPVPPDDAPYTFTLEQGSLTMRDGVQLGVTYYRPNARQAQERFPVILEMVPYRKDDFFALSDYGYGAYFAKHGYVMARVDVRGTGASTGAIPVSEYSEAEIEDAEEIIAQLAQKPWSNGKVGMQGISWSAINALITAQRKPRALKAVIAAHGFTDQFYNDVHYIDGVLHLDYYAHQIDTDNALPRSPDYRIDEDYFRDRFDQEPWIFTWLRQQQDGAYWRGKSVHFQAPLEVPAYVIGGLLDGYRDFILDVAQTARAPVIAELGPWNHAWPEYGQPGPNHEWRQRALRWWGHWLKGEATGILDEPRWMAFMRTGHAPDTTLTTTPGHWRCDARWPVPDARTLQLHPQSEHALAPAASTAGRDALRYRASSGLAAGNWWGELTSDMAPDDAGSLTYDSAVLTEPVDIMGMPQVQLQVVADAPHYAWSVRLEDVAPDGRVSLVSGALINPSQRLSRLDPQPLVPGEPATLTARIHLTTWRFQPGHRIRLAVSNAQFPMAWPTPTAGRTALLLGAQTWLQLPVVSPADDRASACALPAPEQDDRAPFGKDVSGEGPTYEARYDAATGQASATVSGHKVWTIGDNHYRSDERYLWSVRDADPAQAEYQARRRNQFTIDGHTIDLTGTSRITSDATHFHVSFTKTLKRDGELVRERTWRDRIARRHQ